MVIFEYLYFTSTVV